MGFDKAKAVRAAEKFLAQGKIPAAIQEYRRIAEQDAGDFSALNTLGDLYSRVDQKEEAITCFARVAEHYRQQGFALKAIAMYKKVTRLNPGDPDVASKLAKLYEQQGLLAEARAQYLTVADAYTRAGKTRETLEVLRRVADLDPNNTQIRLRLAESFLREGIRDMAAEAFTEAAGRLSSRGDHERALEAYTKALTIEPHNHTTLSGFVGAHAALGTADEAAEILVQAIADRPGDTEMRAMLVRAHLEADDVPAAERAADELIGLDPSSYTLLFEVARLYLKQGEIEPSVRVLSRVLEPALSGREEGTLLELLNEALARNPEQIAALNMLVRVSSWQRDEEQLRIAYQQLAEVAEAAGLEDQERDALVQLIRLVPGEARYYERLKELGGVPENFETAGEESYAPATPVESEVPTFESFMLKDGPPAPAGPSPMPPANEAVAPPTTEFEWNTVAEKSAPPAASPADASSSFADLNDFADTSAAPGGFSAPAAPPASDSFGSSFQEIDFTTTAADGTAKGGQESATATPAAGGPDPLASLLKQELESVDFYLAQGYTDIARDTLDMLERQYGAHPEIATRRNLSQGAAAAEPVAPSPPPTPAAESVEFSGFDRYDVADEVPAGAATDGELTDELDTAFADLSLETPANAAPPEEASTPAFASSPPPAETSPASSSPPRPALDPGLAAIFDEFRIAVEDEEQAAEGDYETHYNLGLAYKEMELLDEAIEEFQQAIGMVAPHDGTPRYLQCCNLLGHCFALKAMPQAAAQWFKKGLDAPGQTEDEYQALRYELGNAYEQMGDLSRAIEVFTEVYGIDVSYRGVSDKLRDLQEAQRAAK